MQFLSPGPSSPTAAGGPEFPQQKNFFGGSLFTTPPEEVGDLVTDSRSRRGWLGGEKGFSISRRVSRNEKANNEKQRYGKEMSGEEPTKEKKEDSKGESQDEIVRVGKFKVKAKSEAPEEEGVTEHTGLGEVEKDDGTLPVREGDAGEVRAADQHPKSVIAERTGDGTENSLRDPGSSRSPDPRKSTNQRRGSEKPGKKRWRLMTAKRSTPGRIPIPSKNLTEDVAGSRFQDVNDPEGERCAGDYPPIYVDGFVSLILSSHLYFS